MEQAISTTPAFALHLIVDDVDRGIRWYEQALGARVTRILRLPDRTIATAELDLHGLQIALAAPVPGTELASPATSGTSAAAYRLRVEDTDAAMQRALAAGATPSRNVEDAFWGCEPGRSSTRPDIDGRSTSRCALCRWRRSRAVWRGSGLTAPRRQNDHDRSGAPRGLRPARAGRPGGARGRCSAGPRLLAGDPRRC
ncbi:hypothetical protein GCM10025881_11880 [Pseudolysinimonas kribbensis]|uniref:Glyoxalase/fosfomycin resistance/dioxygenase domain-containing protein n=1 Tax=Pseudolysinimonas kribbensis TaxID=433641 RepID=A0ABQ6K233_9MICO|nr:VOC family protein [Pseudolysinimonas kribbensis]GMA94364.1 hypothetical protein GCM10025881_11880 [Pseudolysinimonas kribbensis]